MSERKVWKIKSTRRNDGGEIPFEEAQYGLIIYLLRKRLILLVCTVETILRTDGGKETC